MALYVGQLDGRDPAQFGAHHRQLHRVRRAELDVVERVAVVDDQIDPSYPSGRVIAGDICTNGERLVLSLSRW